MNWGSREECRCPSTVWGGMNFWPRWYTKKVLDTLSNLALKTRYLMIQHKSLFNLVKDLFKWIEGLGRSVAVRVQSEGEWIFDLGGIRKKYLIRCQISRSKLVIVFQNKSLFNLVKDFFKWIEGLGRSVTVRVQSEGKNLTYVVYEKITWYVVKFRAQELAIVFQKKIAFQPSQGLIQMNWGSREECRCPSTVWGGMNFWPRWYTKKVLDTLSNFALKTRYLKFQHKSLFNLVKDFFKWIEGLGRSVTVRVQSEGKKFDLCGIRKNYLIRCQISRSKTRYSV